MKQVSALIGLFILTNLQAQIPELKKASDVGQKKISENNREIQRRRLDFTQYVNPFIGTGAHGHTYPGAVAPFGMIQLGPDTRYNGWDGCSGYHYSDSIIYGFSHTHLSGTGVEDLCDLLIVPQQGKIKTIPGYLNKNGYGSQFKHEQEKAKPGFYSVKLLKNNIDVRLAATDHSGIHEYTFHQKRGKKYILIDLDHRDQLLAADIKVIGKNQVQGHRRSNSWAKKQEFFFHLETNGPFISAKLKGKNKLILTFPTSTEKILIKVGISAVDVEGAKKNLFEEIPYFDFEQVKDFTKDQWNLELNKIHFTSPEADVMSNFYTAVYHSYICPSLFTDVDGRFRGNDNQIHQSHKSERYTTFSIWDTYRAAHPLYTITQQKRTVDFIQSFLGIYQETGELPVWELWGNETDCMIGYHAVSIINDAYQKGIRDFDLQQALDAMIKTAEKKELGKNLFIDNEFISSNLEPESVSKTLEYAYDDWNIGVFARSLGNMEITDRFTKKSFQYLNVFNPVNKFMQARRSGTWNPGFIPSEVNFNFTEANSWQYSLSTPHDINGLRFILGGKDSLERWLDRLFNVKSKLDGRQQADITGLIGQYAHGNEPSHHMAYLYNYTNTPYKTAQRVDEILRNLYQPSPEGLSGNEDCGQMSAWYVFSAMGIYPVCPGSTSYQFGRPLQENAIINLENGNSMILRTINNSKENKYIQGITLNGELYQKNYIEHEDLMKGGEIIFEMGNSPNLKLNSYVSDQNVNTTHSFPIDIIPVPYFVCDTEFFTDSINVSIAVLNFPDIIVKYTIDGSEPDWNSLTYSNSLIFNKTTTLKAKSFRKINGLKSKWLSNDKNAVSSTFQKIDKNLSLEIETPFANQYAAGGNNALIDGLVGGSDFRSGAWQGYEGNDLKGELSINDSRILKSVSFNCLQDIKSWIFMPTKIDLSYSIDGHTFVKLKSKSFSYDPKKQGQFIDFIQFDLPPQAIKKLKFTVKNRAVCPKGHLGAGEKSWIFLDEILFK